MTECSEAEKQLHAKLFNDDYNSAVRPVNNGKDSVGVNITMNIHQIVDVVNKFVFLFSSIIIIIFYAHFCTFMNIPQINKKYTLQKSFRSQEQF